jgi:hypothetical protein
MALQGPGSDPSERIFNDLRSKNDEVKNKAAIELRDLITLLSRGEHARFVRPVCADRAQNGRPNDSPPSTTKLRTASATTSSRRLTRATK